MTLLPLLLRHWRAVAGLTLLSLLTILIAVRTGERDRARRALADERQAAALFAEQVRGTAARIRADMAARTIDVERRQSNITQEVSSAYQARLHDLDRRVAALRLLGRAPGANSGRPDRAARLPNLPGAAGGSDAAAGEDRLPAAHFDPGSESGTGGLRTSDAIIATEQAIRLEELQNWVRRQAAVNPPGR